MFKFMIIFYQPDAPRAFENSYNDLLGLVERMPEVTRRQVINVVGSPAGQSPIHRILEVYFEDRAAMERSLMSPAGQEAGKELYTFPDKSFEMVFADVYEEAGGSTPRQTGDES